MRRLLKPYKIFTDYPSLNASRSGLIPGDEIVQG